MASVTVIPSDNTGITNLTTNNTYPATRGYTNADSTTYARFGVQSTSDGYIYYKFDTSSIPANATISSVTARAKLRVSNISNITGTVCQLCSGTTTKGSNTTFQTTTATVFDLSTGTSWSRSDLTDLRIKVGARRSGSNSGWFNFYGADVTITYSEGGGSTNTLYFKDNGSWVSATKAYKKVSGSWVEQSDLTTVFANGTNYVKGN